MSHVRRARSLAVETLEARLVPASNFTVNFQITSDWGSGFGANVVVTNTGPDPVRGWRLEFDMDRSINTIWNADNVSRVGNHHTLKNKSYNADVPVGGQFNFGFNGSLGNVRTMPSGWKLNGLAAGGTTPTPPTPPPALSVADAAAVVEGNNASFTVTLSRAATTAVTVNFATSAGTATAGSDFVARAGTLTFAPGETSKVVAVSTVNDTTAEQSESFRLLLSAPSGATLADAEGVATITDNDTPTPPPPAPGSFNYAEALQKALFFYEANRSGDLPDNYTVSWRSDSAMTDGSDVGLDLTGGYYDAGDHVKFALPMASAMTELAWGLIRYKDGYERSGQLARIRESLKWGTDWLIKAHPSANVFYAQVGNGGADHSFWGSELMTMARPSYRLDPTKPGSDAAGEAAATLAAASIAFKGVDDAYSALLLRHARELFTFADTYRGKYSDSIPDAANYYNSYSGYNDELAWAATWLHKATGEASYLAKAEALYGRNFAGQTMTWTHSWDDKRYGAAILLAGTTGKQVYKTDAERYLDYWSVGINGGNTRITYTSGGLAFLNGWGSLRYATTTAFMAMLYADTVRDIDGRYLRFAKSQIDYALGANPRNSSYLVGFGVNPPKNPHHRGASGVYEGNVDSPIDNRHILYGALVGGPESADDFNYQDVRGDYISNEVALDYNAGITGALAALVGRYDGTALANFPVAETPTGEFFVRANIDRVNPTSTDIKARINNRSAWPARGSTNLSLRYYMDLTEVYAAGLGVADVRVQSYYANGSTLSAIKAYDVARNIYYVEVSFAGVNVRPGAGTYEREMQLRVGLLDGAPASASAWDPTNDWSYRDLALNDPKMTAYIPVFEGTKKLFGQHP